MSEIRDQVVGVHIYPIKSLHEATIDGQTVSSLEVGPTGFQAGEVRDREFVIYDPNERAIVTQRGWSSGTEREKFPQDKQLAAVATDIHPDHLAIAASVGHLEISAEPAEGAVFDAEIFNKRFRGIDQGPEASEFFSRLLSRDVVLLRADRAYPRLLPLKYLREGATNQVAGADGFPFLLTSEASLASLIPDAAPAPPLNHFRGNIEIDGSALGPFGEDYIDPDREFTIGRLGFWAVKPCARCPIPNIDQDTGELAAVKATPILKTRVGTRRGGDSPGMFFGQNLMHCWPEGQSISVGDVVAVGGLSVESSVILRAPKERI